jgi:electron-transferring-flavoprotein dehydrogenase
MKSGIEAAKAIYEDIDSKSEIESYEKNMRQSWTWEELYKERNVKKAFKYGMKTGIVYSALAGHIFRGKEPWNLKNTVKDSECTEKKNKHTVLFII